MTNGKKKNEQQTSENRHQGVRGFIFSGKRLWVILILAAITVAVLVFSLAL